MTFQASISQIRKGQLGTNYFLAGTERYLRQQLQDALIDQVDQAGSFEVSRFDLNDTELAAILDEADAFSFFADKRVRAACFACKCRICVHFNDSAVCFKRFVCTLGGF